MDKQDYDLVHTFEEMAMSMENFAEVLSVYYKSLIEKGIPEEITEQMVIELNRRFCSLFGK